MCNGEFRWSVRKQVHRGGGDAFPSEGGRRWGPCGHTFPHDAGDAAHRVADERHSTQRGHVAEAGRQADEVVVAEVQQAQHGQREDAGADADEAVVMRAELRQRAARAQFVGELPQAVA